MTTIFMHISLYLPHLLPHLLNLPFTLSFLFVDEPAKSDRLSALAQKKSNLHSAANN